MFLFAGERKRERERERERDINELAMSTKRSYKPLSVNLLLFSGVAWIWVCIKIGRPDEDRCCNFFNAPWQDSAEGQANPEIPCACLLSDVVSWLHVYQTKVPLALFHASDGHNLHTPNQYSGSPVRLYLAPSKSSRHSSTPDRFSTQSPH